MSRNDNQTTSVLSYLKEHGSITSLEAINKFGATRLSAIIFNLRKRGYSIETYMCEGETRFGDTTRYAKYVYYEEA